MAGNFQAGIKAGATSISVTVLLRKTADNTEKTGVAAAGVTSAYYWRQGGTPTALTALSDLAAITTAYTAGGWKEADSTHSPGAYRLDVDNAAFATGADWVEICVVVSTCYAFHERYALTTNVPQSGDSFPSVNTGVAPGAANGLLISGTNTGPWVVNGGVTFQNSGGDGFICQSTNTAGGGRGMLVQGAGSGNSSTCAGMLIIGGATGQGLEAVGGSTSGIGFRARAQGGNSHGIAALANGTGHDFYLGISGDIYDSVNATRLVEFKDLSAVPTNFSSMLISSSGHVGIQSGITTNTQLSNFKFPMVLKTDHITPATGKTITAQRAIDNGSYANCANAVTEVGNGTYMVTLSGSDMNGANIKLLFTETTCDPCEITLVTTP